jgi:hypothetical protein
VIFVGVDWAEGNHMVCVMDGEGEVLARKRVPDGPEGLRWIHEAIAKQDVEAEDVVVGIETDHGLFVQALVGAGYKVYAINSFMMTRYRERQSNTGK